MTSSFEPTRRDFLRGMGLLAGGAVAAASPLLAAGQPDDDLIVVTGEDPKANVKKAIEAMGGMKRFVSRGDVVVIKPNIAFERPAESGAATHPDVVVGLIEMALDAGAKEVKIFDRPVQNPKVCYPMSGIPEAAQKAGAKVFFHDELESAPLAVPNGKHLKKSSLYKIALECDCYINVPVAKHHRMTQLTLAMKNHLGLTADDRQFWHKNLPQAIADFSSAFKPHVNVLDAYRCIFQNGPRGGGPQDLKVLKKCIVGLNPASVDAYGATLFDKKPSEIPHIAMAGEMGIGEIDVAKLKIRQVTA